MTPHQFIARVQRGDVPSTVLLLGPEAYHRRRSLQALRGRDVTRYDLNQTAMAEVIDDARSLSLFTAERVILATNAEAAMPKTDDNTRAAIKEPAPGVVLIFEALRFDFEGEDKKKIERVRKYFAEVRDVVELRRHSPDEARQEAQAMSKAAGVSMEPGALESLVESLGADLARLETEIGKLASFAPGRRITLHDIAALVPDARETTIFALVSALGRRDRMRALDVLDTLCRDGEYLPLALSFLSTQLRMALMAKEAGLRSAPQIQGHFSKSGVPMWGSRADQVAQTLGKFSKEQLERGLKLIFEADCGLRSARPDDRIVMERFVVELTGA